MPLFFTIIPRVTNGANVVKLLPGLPLGLLRCSGLHEGCHVRIQFSCAERKEGKYVLVRVAFFPPR